MTTETAAKTADKSEAEKQAEYVAKLQGEINSIILERDKAQGQLDSLKSFNVPDDNVAVMAFVEDITDANGRLERAQGRMASYERGQMTGKFIQPLIDGYGELEVGDPAAFTGSFQPSNLDTIEADLKKQGESLADRIKAFTRFRREFVKAKIPAEIVTEFRPLRFVAVEGKSAIKLDIANARVGTTTGTRGARQVERITSAPNAFYVDKIVGGENADFANWTKLAEDAHTRGVITDEQWTRLTTTSDGNPRSVSFRGTLQSRFKFTAEIVGGTVEAAATPETNESDDASNATEAAS